MQVGIIGGTGKMGTLFARVFTEAGHTVEISGRTTSRTAEDLAKKSDILIISVPIHETVRIIDQISPLMDEKQILCDLTSIKAAPVQAMMTSDAEVLGLHPMFGPTAGTLQGQTIVATPARCSEKTLHLFRSIFESQGARVTITTPEHHDRMMAIVQGLTHFKALVMADTIRRLGITPEEAEPFMSPVYRIETSIAGRLLAQDPMLYADILCTNPSVPSVLHTCCNAAESLALMISSGDIQGFVEQFMTDRAWFGEYCTRSLNETDQLIASMVRS
ncbi:MAG TPA: prephenate dehydrogenase/arogenate dehydrogenase family protein [Methanospirillum sp.]|nr:prephenate dehydrogenase/arogenate dehydrogenase family protein [Methanospirillum sp.]